MVHWRANARIGGGGRGHGPGRARPRAFVLSTFAWVPECPRRRGLTDGGQGLAAALDKRCGLSGSKVSELGGVPGGKCAGGYGVYNAAIGSFEFAIRAASPACGENRPGRSRPLGARRELDSPRASPPLVGAGGRVG